MAIISPQRINELKTAVRDECKRRAYSGSVASYGGTSYDFTNVPAVGKIIQQEHLTKNATPLNAINSDVIDALSNQKVALDENLTEMEAFVAVLGQRSPTDHSGTDCKSGCTGMCYGCQGTCYNACTSCTGNCTGSCSGDCSGGCTGGCYSSCQYGCEDNCASNCYGGCKGTCSGGCSGGCGMCGNQCANDCVQTCTGSCSGSCSGTCSGTCKNGVGMI